MVKFPDAVVAFEARADDLMVTIDSREKAEMKDVVASHLDRFAFREAPLRSLVGTRPELKGDEPNGR